MCGFSCGVLPAGLLLFTFGCMAFGCVGFCVFWVLNLEVGWLTDFWCFVILSGFWYFS